MRGFCPMEYETICSFETLYAAYLRARRGKRKKLRTQRFEANALESLYEIAEQLKDGSYRPGAFEHFKVYEPKERDIEAPAFEDKVVLHAVTDNGLYDAITSGFIRNNCSNQKGKGTADAVIRLKQCFVRYYARYKTASGWVLKCDIRHFFASIDHNVAKAKLLAVCEKYGIDPRIYELLCRYIDNSPQGLPLGYQTSQLLALLMLDALDHAVTETLGFPLYVRGMDDFVVIAYNKQDLQTLLREIRRLTGSIGLELNEKTAIFPLENGVDFLGFHTYFTKTGGVVQKLRRSSLKRMKDRIKRWRHEYAEGRISAEKIRDSFQAWDAHAAFGDTWGIRSKLAKEVEGIIGIKVPIHRKLNSTRAQRKARRERQQRFIEKKRRRAFDCETQHRTRNPDTPPWE